MDSQKEKDNNAHIYICLYTCIEEWALFVFFQNHKTFFLFLWLKNSFCRKKKKKKGNIVTTAGGVLWNEKYNIYTRMAKRKG